VEQLPPPVDFATDRSLKCHLPNLNPPLLAEIENEKETKTTKQTMWIPLKQGLGASGVSIQGSFVFLNK